MNMLEASPSCGPGYVRVNNDAPQERQMGLVFLFRLALLWRKWGKEQV